MLLVEKLEGQKDLCGVKPCAFLSEVFDVLEVLEELAAGDEVEDLFSVCGKARYHVELGLSLEGVPQRDYERVLHLL